MNITSLSKLSSIGFNTSGVDTVIKFGIIGLIVFMILYGLVKMLGGFS